MSDSVAVRLARVWTALVIETDSAVEAAIPDRFGDRFRISAAVWANALRVLDDDAIVEQVAGRSGARMNLPGMERWGWVRLGDRRRGDDGFGTARGVRTDTPVRLTEAGRAAREHWPERVDDVERRWVARFGRQTVDALLATAVPPGAPWAPPEVHASDGFRTAVVAPGPQDGPRPLLAVLGGALTARTIRAERDGGPGVPLRANLLHALRPGPLRRRELPSATGLSKEGIAMSLTAARRARLIEDVDDSTVRLTAAGAALHGAEGADEPADADDALATVLDDADALREGLKPPPGTWRAAPPYLARTRWLLEDPAKRLPRHPMVLHRGGWPDAS